MIAAILGASLSRLLFIADPANELMFLAFPTLNLAIARVTTVRTQLVPL